MQAHLEKCTWYNISWIIVITPSILICTTFLIMSHNIRFALSRHTYIDAIVLMFRGRNWRGRKAYRKFIKTTKNVKGELNTSFLGP